jgi:hypothetical protein
MQSSPLKVNQENTSRQGKTSFMKYARLNPETSINSGHTFQVKLRRMFLPYRDILDGKICHPLNITSKIYI